MTVSETAERLKLESTGGAFVAADRLSQMRTSTDPAGATAAWLEILNALIAGMRQGLVVLGSPAGTGFAPSAIWPRASKPSRALMAAADAAVRGGRVVIERGAPTRDADAAGVVTIGYPITFDGRVRGAAAIELPDDTGTDTRLALDHLAWGCGWLETIIRRRNVVPGDRLASAIELLATSIHHKHFQDAATAVATEIAGTLGCERVAIGFLRGRHVRVRALSNSASFGKKAKLVRSLEAAMDEAVDQQAAIVFPPPSEARILVTRAHDELFKSRPTGPICTVPLAEGRRLLGAMTLEKPEGEVFDLPSVQLCEYIAALLGPILEVKRREDRWLPVKAWDSLMTLLRQIFGARHVGLKLAVLACAAVAAFLYFARGEYRVTADATLEGVIQRAVAAPIAGYLAEANVRAGDIVRGGQVVAMLDDRDLRLEKLKWASQRAKQEREYSDALSKHERAKAQILQTQIDQAAAQIELLNEQLARLRIVAPFDGYVVSGDLSQALGAPVERGNVLFEIAPLNEYRVLMKVDERDVSLIKVDQTGELALSASPERGLPIRVTKITPISSAEEGRNFFRIEASIAGEIPASLRPGMQGVGKVLIDERRYAWIWTHRIVHWIRMTLWSWWP